MSDILLEVTSLYKSFGGLAAITDVSFSLNERQILGVIGPNGAGKTTLFNLLTGFIKPDRGSVKYNGEDVTGIKPHKLTRLGISRSFQMSTLFPNMTVLDSLLIPQYFTRKGRRRKTEFEMIKRCDDLLQIIDLREKKNNLVNSLTQGELKLLDIARSLATEPSLLLLDEPFSGLGIKDIQPLSQLIKELSGQGLTLMVVEHKLKELMSFVDRVIVINFGALIAEGTPYEIVNNDDVINSYLGDGGAEIDIT